MQPLIQDILDQQELLIEKTLSIGNREIRGRKGLLTARRWRQGPVQDRRSRGAVAGAVLQDLIGMEPQSEIVFLGVSLQRQPATVVRCHGVRHQGKVFQAIREAESLNHGPRHRPQQVGQGPIGRYQTQFQSAETVLRS